MSGTVADTSLGELIDEREALRDLVGERTLQILEHRRLSKSHRRGWLVRRALLAADLAGLLVAFLGAEALYAGRESGSFNFGSELALFVLTLPVWALIARAYGLYSQDDQRTNHVTTDEVASVFNMVTVCTWFFFAFTWLTAFAHPAVPKLILFWALAALLVPLGRVTARALARTRPSFVQNTVIVGAGNVGQAVAEKLLRHPEYGVNLVGFVDSRPGERNGAGSLPILGSPERLPAIIRVFDVERVIIAFPQDPHERVLALIRSLKDAFVQVDIVSRYYDLIGPSTRISMVEGIPVLGLPPRALGLSSRMLKRSMDLAISFLALVLLSPVFLVVALLIKLDSPGGVFFRQARVGAGGKDFQILKFRTMVQDAESKKAEFAHLNKHAGRDSRMFKIVDDPRVTRVGRALRRLSLDELPQLVNVAWGEMSLVGPRPLIPSEDQRVEDWGRSRLELRPGMTGLWQVLGRSEIPFEEMVRLDYVYVTNWSIWQDLRLLFGTMPAVVRGGRGAY